MYIFAHFKTFGIFENLMLFDPFLFPSLTSNPGLPYWTSRQSRKHAQNRRNQAIAKSRFGGTAKMMKNGGFSRALPGGDLSCDAEVW